MEVTKEMREEYFEATGMYSSDEEILRWYLSKKDSNGK